MNRLRLSSPLIDAHRNDRWDSRLYTDVTSLTQGSYGAEYVATIKGRYIFQRRNIYYICVIYKFIRGERLWYSGNALDC